MTWKKFFCLIDTKIHTDVHFTIILVAPKVIEQQPYVPPRKPSNSLLKVSFENGVAGANNKYVTPYKHDPTVMNADLPLPPVTFRRPVSSSSNFNQRRTYPKIDEAEEFLLQRDDLSLQQHKQYTVG